MKKTDFALFINRFFTEYLAGNRNLSQNTISSYRDTIVQLIEFLINTKSVRLEKISMSTVSKEVIEEFLDHIENERNCSISTRNQRLCAIHSFFRYAGMSEPQYMFEAQRILSIQKKKDSQTEIHYLTAEETKELLSAPDTSTKRGRRDQALLCLLYDSGARVQEVADLCVQDIRFEKPCQVKLKGKGRKTRIVPLMSETAAILKAYLDENNLSPFGKSEHPLFFNGQGNKLTRQGITYILQKYTTAIPVNNISPHSLRHSKAIHMTEADINPVYIRDFLGHSDLKTTQIYSKTSVEMKRKALEKLTVHPVPDKEEQKADWTKDQDLMIWLKSLQ